MDSSRLAHGRVIPVVEANDLGEANTHLETPLLELPTNCRRELGDPTDCEIITRCSESTATI
jgi:hypothetical protein